MPPAGNDRAPARATQQHRRQKASPARCCLTQRRQTGRQPSLTMATAEKTRLQTTVLLNKQHQERAAGGARCGQVSHRTVPDVPRPSVILPERSGRQDLFDSVTLSQHELYAEYMSNVGKAVLAVALVIVGVIISPWIMWIFRWLYGNVYATVIFAAIILIVVGVVIYRQVNRSRPRDA